MADREGYFTSMGRMLDESMGMMNDFRTGKLTRAQFDRWYDRRRRDGMDMVFKMRDRTAGLRQPVDLAFDIGRSFVGGPTSPPFRRRSRRRVSSRRGAAQDRRGAATAARGASTAARGVSSVATGGRNGRRSGRRASRR